MSPKSLGDPPLSDFRVPETGPLPVPASKPETSENPLDDSFFQDFAQPEHQPQAREMVTSTTDEQIPPFALLTSRQKTNPAHGKGFVRQLDQMPKSIQIVLIILCLLLTLAIMML